jgi:hypothetical protein
VPRHQPKNRRGVLHRMRSNGQDAEAALRHDNPCGESISRSQKNALTMRPLRLK